MGSRDDHLRQWKHNRAFLAEIPPGYPDWMVTATFYVALQAVDALLAHDKVTRVTSHETRNDVLMRTNRYHAIWTKYQPLHDLSRKIRYLADPAKWVPIDQVEKNVIRRYLYPIETSVQKLMGVSLNLPTIVLQAAPPAGATLPPGSSGPGPTIVAAAATPPPPTTKPSGP